jgi:hypothetical protein
MAGIEGFEVCIILGRLATVWTKNGQEPCTYLAWRVLLSSGILYSSTAKDFRASFWLVRTNAAYDSDEKPPLKARERKWEECRTLIFPGAGWQRTCVSLQYGMYGEVG